MLSTQLLDFHPSSRCRDVTVSFHGGSFVATLALTIPPRVISLNMAIGGTKRKAQEKAGPAKFTKTTKYEGKAAGSKSSGPGAGKGSRPSPSRGTEVAPMNHEAK